MAAKCKGKGIHPWGLLALVICLLLQVMTPGMAAADVPPVSSAAASVSEADPVPQRMVVQEMNQVGAPKGCQADKAFKARLMVFMLRQLFAPLCPESAPLPAAPVHYRFSPSDPILSKGP
ncbi:hypothetical protein [Pontibacter sp. SGAir0037]|uniref:hypothetical protein n=1 Tax=Pontibacter sp. SGAir0037 TaxID=2571030 RepID=UPI0010CD4A29|nr:hypothetical protein [Pontibacter sp. SGAir0037]QCR22393.1 hypothetical protein C1N53_08620 [Pontibacter sp. SGAir0037]QCR24670.1 hypothetical protein C1N53_21475 [Pontibacter sp. SGAir0037]